MARILCVWELGGGLGHLVRLQQLALMLRAYGHEPVFALRDLTHAPLILGKFGFGYRQAPYFRPSTPIQHTPALSYVEVLLRCGFKEPLDLYQRVQAWRNLYREINPDFVLLDHAPSALLALHGTKIPRALYGTGFFSPPRAFPIPAFLGNHVATQSRCVESEASVLNVINQVLFQMQCPPLPRVCDLFQVNEDFLCTFEELDHYPGRVNARYWGNVFASSHSSGLRPSWPCENKSNVFVYVSSKMPDLERLIETLKQALYASVVVCTGLSKQDAECFRAENVQIYTQPVDMQSIADDCDMAILSGPGTAASLLLRGVPLLMCPMHVEQYLGARRIAEYGAGLVSPPADKFVDYRALINTLLVEHSFRQRAQQFAQKYKNFDSDHQMAEIVVRIEEILSVR